MGHAKQVRKLTFVQVGIYIPFYWKLCYPKLKGMERIMSDFITMQCPSCGGNLAVGNNALSLKCEHCGAEHMIRREADGIILESYARCPMCNRNDKAEKVTAIMRSQTQNTQGVSYQSITTNVKIGDSLVPVNQRVEVPIQTSQISDLAKHLTPPSQPQSTGEPYIEYRESHKKLYLAIFLGIIGVTLLLGTLGVLAIVNSERKLDTTDILIALFICGPISFAPLVVSFWLFFFSIPKGRKKNKEEIESKRNEMQLQSRLQFDKGLKIWKNAMERWNKLYYCGRDDCCVFR
jgi:predicted RNA-binding Zn-ribbon protein involved in translation (DUF1610 family)